MKKLFINLIVLLNIVISLSHVHGMDESLGERDPSTSAHVAKRRAIPIKKALSCANFCIELSDLQKRTLTNLELNKILYYGEAFSLAFYGKPIGLAFCAWERGAVSVEVYEAFKLQGKNSPLKAKDLLKDQREEALSPEEKLCFISSYFLEKSLGIWPLVSWHHEESPWKETPQLEQIDTLEICKYFKKTPSHSIPLIKILVDSSSVIESTFQTVGPIQPIIVALNLLRRYINEQGPEYILHRAICIRDELERPSSSLSQLPWFPLSEEGIARQFHTIRWPLQKKPEEDNNFIFGSLFFPDDVAFPREPFASLYLRKYTLELLSISAGYGNGEGIYYFNEAFDFLVDDSEGEVDEKQQSLKQEVHAFTQKYFQDTESLLDAQIASDMPSSFERSQVSFLKGLVLLLHHQAPKEASSFFKESLDIPRAAYLYASTAQFEHPEERRNMYQRAVDGGFIYAKLELCKYFSDIDDPQAQYEAFLKCGKEEKLLPEGYYRAAYLLKNHPEIRTDFSFEELLEKAGEGGMLQAFESLAKKAVKGEDNERAKEYYKKMISQGDTKAFYNLAKLLIAEEKNDQAIDHLQQTLWFGWEELQRLDPSQSSELLRQKQYQYLEFLKQMALHETPDV